MEPTRGKARMRGEGALQRLDEPPSMVVLDVDGTLLTSDHRVTESTRQAVLRARHRDVRVMLATSRGPSALLGVLRDLEPLRREFFIASQGAVIGRYDSQGRLDILRQCPAPLPAARELVVVALELGLSVSWFTGARWLVSHVDAMVEAEIEAVGAEPRWLTDVRVHGSGQADVYGHAGELEPLQQVSSRIQKACWRSHPTRTSSRSLATVWTKGPACAFRLRRTGDCPELGAGHGRRSERPTPVRARRSSCGTAKRAPASDQCRQVRDPKQRRGRCRRRVGAASRPRVSTGRRPRSWTCRARSAGRSDRGVCRLTVGEAVDQCRPEVASAPLRAHRSSPEGDANA